VSERRRERVRNIGLTHSKGRREKHSRVERERERKYSHAPGGLRVTMGISHGKLLLIYKTK